NATPPKTRLYKLVAVLGNFSPFSSSTTFFTFSALSALCFTLCSSLFLFLSTEASLLLSSLPFATAPSFLFSFFLSLFTSFLTSPLTLTPVPSSLTSPVDAPVLLEGFPSDSLGLFGFSGFVSGLFSGLLGFSGFGLGLFSDLLGFSGFVSGLFSGLLGFSGFGLGLFSDLLGFSGFVSGLFSGLLGFS